MLCEDCEKKFGPFDEYGFKILGRSNLTERPLLHNGRLYGYEINCDTDRLHRFVLSVLWRAAVTRLPAFSSLELRQYREPLLRVIFATAPIDGGYYQTIIFRLADDYLGEFSNVMFEPVASFQKDKSVMCQLYIPRLKIVTFIGNRTYIPNWMKLYDPNKAVLAYLSASMNQQEYGFLHRIHSAYHAAKSSFR